ncbi:ATP-binding cassette domain-containing protein [Frankia sp. CNm7]|uniref:ATP-binding cassette domain-containing protein n=1 Tax=Frankia nepalensis TaxID=1836974 RepID=A0A937RLV4_9ACTN|nr:ATP-binding cassette domain-containing protein [Frankia nepalensis]MBL7499259.1 ATP-binding cassette domain-containing protein [Frankia nepalensis]MBL7513488.1 ATP-binding cassette domain-containing protein [Frankia nepalensis]MBL7521844.1 ATP-binding cassette domain-containing protein [Frankia nepalensis]MBL7628763.1 ATP-binding cassette domain-containing protein [Frankia nepalensis]
MTPPPAALEISGLSAGYNGVPAVRDLSISVAQGEVLALLGPNGAGKTTTLLAAVGLLPALRGSVVALGTPLRGRRVERTARAGVSLVPAGRGVFHQLTVAENLRLARRRGGADLDETLGHFPPLRPLLGRRCGLLSGGEQQMLALAKALLAGPRVLLVDELSLGLAPLAVRGLLPTIRALADERRMAVVLVEQHLDLALSVADRAVVLHHGRVALAGRAAELRERRDLVEAAYFGHTDPASPFEPSGSAP